MKSFAIILLTCFFFIGCSSPYQPKSALGGYSSTKIDDETYRVEFKGNQHTKTIVVFEHLVRRCAEITVDEGYEYFIVYEDSSYTDKTIFKNEPGIDNYLDYIEFREDRYSLTEKTGMDYDPLQTLKDTKNRIKRTYTSYTSQDGSCNANTLVGLEATGVVGVYKILLANKIVENFRDYYFPAKDILENYK